MTSTPSPVAVVLAVALLATLTMATTTTNTTWFTASLDGNIYALDPENGSLDPRGSFSWNGTDELQLTLSQSVAAGDAAGERAYFAANNVGETPAAVIVAVDVSVTPVTFVQSQIYPFYVDVIHVDGDDLVVLANLGNEAIQLKAIDATSLKVLHNLTTPIYDVELVPGAGSAFNAEANIFTVQLYSFKYGIRLVSLNVSAHNNTILYFPQMVAAVVKMAYSPQHDAVFGIVGGGVLPVFGYLISPITGAFSDRHQLTDGLGAFADLSYGFSAATGDVLIGVPRYSGSTDFTLATTATIPFQTAAKFSLPYLATQIVVAMA
ncbi:uncharacterized protein AMSG_08470 [Thecamonas trahens ATCC 50062]|uniref:Uncharacterized protein n=1 Tax=Thecamonas trahens ATCC 50062 TaxID=461836 RepID=A0A0L0DK10_THETB|nr:hypothetical protein AMSG_08470 [Thecamonas trahens ATCC 50062]KNC52607.1 hypothetical protein AMSG_08470 [Thecamonas trahens ATCC 50062]|eukprot:XP_013755166.1 hypothetical protein AMSG_08470 [Thecamonas trahens ATCC 50062]